MGRSRFLPTSPREGTMTQAPVAYQRGAWQAFKTGLLAVELALLAGAILLLALHILR